MADDASAATTAPRAPGGRRRGPRGARRPRSQDGEKGDALALFGAMIAWGVALVHLVNGFTRPLGLVDVRVLDGSGAAAAAREQLGPLVSTVTHGSVMTWTEVYSHRPLDKIDLILFFALLGTACFLVHLLAGRDARGARDVLDGTATARWLGITLVALGTVPTLAQSQGTLVLLRDTGLSDVLVPADPALGWGWVVAGTGIALVLPALRRASRRGRD